VNSQGTQLRRKNAGRALWRVNDMLPNELLVFCPACKALEIVRFSGREMIPTRKFVQKANRVYHTCGSHVPCRLHSSTGRAGPAPTDDARLSAFSLTVSRCSASGTRGRPTAKRAKVQTAA